MQTLIQHGQVYTGGHLVNTDILIKDGRIQALGHDLIDPQSVDTVIDAENLLVSPGLIDVHVHYRDPGLTQKETIRTGSMAAAHGGFTTVGAMPNVDPVPDTPAKIAHMVERNQTEGVVHIKQYASITMGRLSDDLVDYAGVKDAGAFALSNDGNGVQLAGTMYRAMQGAAKAGLPIAAHVEDESLLFGGKMTLGKRSQELGIPGAPSVSESAQVARDLVLANDTGVQYHICHISTKESLAMVKFAKEKGVPVTCEASPHHLLLSDEEIHGENSNYKMNPPLRHTDDRAALQAALKDGTVDMIATDHAPHTVDDKPNDFSCAANGITGSETAFAECYTHLVKQGSLSLERLLDLMATNPADIFHLDGAGRIEVGQPADLAIFDLNHEYEIKESDYLSKGKNTPFTGDHVYGRTIYTLVDGQIVYQAKED
ncbi:dihydroorotase [Limosilactobacillus gastricus]|uniref:Dihydroorotase n=1 Tax=Limosilactobacillus gastricus DSM 16045 TaxID=1423749 RepID=A0A0R1VG37_9LACO|nr:dihydroorotase [Limosilactobacillus gastricus]KRM00876.1 Dihydroorotase [Limosilactobacillus gastricus DSM 16045]QGF40167.1 dihydroorotase [Limosilactobacillus gastricus]